MPRPSSGGARPKPTQSYATASAAASGDLDWDEDELETRLFGENDPAPLPDLPPAPPRAADRPGQVGGELDAAIDIDLSEPPTLATPSVTVVPAAGRTIVPMLPQPQPQQQWPAPQVQVPQSHQPYPPAGMAPMPMFAGAPSTATMPMPVVQMPPPPQPMFSGGPQPMGPPQMAHPGQMAPQQYDFDDRPQRSGAGLVLGILAAAVVLIGAGFALVYLYSQRTATSSTTTASSSDPANAPRSALTVQTTPPDVQLEVDGKPIAGTSPFVVSDLQSGKHKVRISREGYLPFEREIEVGGSGLNLPVSLPHRDVTLLLESDPPGAAMSLIVGGQAYAMGTGGAQFKLTREPTATYQVEASAAGFLTTRVDLAFTGEPAEKVKLTLARDNNAGIAVAPVPVPAGTPPAVDPAKPVVNPTPTPTPTPTPVPATTPSKPKPSKPKPTPPPAVAKTATLRIGANAGVMPAQVFVDGKLAGTTPIGNLKVTPGKHKVKWKWSDGREVAMSVDLADGESKVIKAG